MKRFLVLLPVAATALALALAGCGSLHRTQTYLYPPCDLCDR